MQTPLGIRPHSFTDIGTLSLDIMFDFGIQDDSINLTTTKYSMFHPCKLQTHNEGHMSGVNL